MSIYDTPAVDGTLKNVASRMLESTQSGWTCCACRDCMDIAMSSDVSRPELCSDCKEADCEPHNAQAAEETSQPSWVFECQREDAYGM